MIKIAEMQALHNSGHNIGFGAKKKEPKGEFAPILKQVMKEGESKMGCQESCPVGDLNICCHSCENEEKCINSCTKLSGNCENATKITDAEIAISRLNVGLRYGNCLIDEELAKHMIEMLKELQTLRKVKVRPATKFLSNTIPQQLLKIKEEFQEVFESISTGEFKKHEALQELMDLQGACETEIHIIEPDRNNRINEKIQHFQKDDIRGYFN